MDVLDVPIMCGSDSPSFPYKPTVGIVQWQKSRFLPPVGVNPSAGGRNPPPQKKSIELETVVSLPTRTNIIFINSNKITKDREKES